MSSKICIAMLNTDTPVPIVRPRFDTYGQMFNELLVAAASRICPTADIQSTYHDVVQLEYPESLVDVDVVLVTGSVASAYDDMEWIRRLDRYLLDVYIRHPRVKLFGSCFGHQMICQSLLRNYGVRVEKDPQGWELGVREIKIEDNFRKALGQRSRIPLDPQFAGETPDTIRIQFIHADHVKIPEPDAIPEQWLMLGKTKHCTVQGVYEPGRVLTMQGHFEFDRWVSTENMKVFGATWNEDVLEQTFRCIDADDDSEAAAEMVLRFILEEEAYETTDEVVTGLLTPPRDKSEVRRECTITIGHRVGDMYNGRG
ncbi:class I glutamine amidotransferase-like protein [Massarina eburnea CBS 473.64]|uniref:Class I glutamine amidotransferase-like protein n=1 Tax=Massarina eburnea CBS 473.64 TaxID=1395130 RepID=A0A6A6S9F8_9PLEO|nr:class I glutamine amidotransferase-like protein [Massarina eburnea CBS 473.64]